MRKLMIVDDSSTMRKIIRRTLDSAGIEFGAAVEAANGLEALEFLAQDAEIDLILTDVNMPDMDGIDMVRRAREIRSKAALPIIMISAEGSEAMQREAIREGANGYITKPFTAESVLATLEPYLD